MTVVKKTCATAKNSPKIQREPQFHCRNSCPKAPPPKKKLKLKKHNRVVEEGTNLASLCGVYLAQLLSSVEGAMKTQL